MADMTPLETAGAAIVSALVSALAFVWRYFTARMGDHEKQYTTNTQRWETERKEWLSERERWITERTLLRNACEEEKDKLRKAHQQEVEARIADAKEGLAMNLKLQETVLVAVNENRHSGAKVIAELAANTEATRKLTEMLSKQPRPPLGSKPG